MAFCCNGLQQLVSSRHEIRNFGGILASQLVQSERHGTEFALQDSKIRQFAADVVSALVVKRQDHQRNVAHSKALKATSSSRPSPSRNFCAWSVYVVIMVTSW